MDGREEGESCERWRGFRGTLSYLSRLSLKVDVLSRGRLPLVSVETGREERQGEIGARRHKGLLEERQSIQSASERFRGWGKVSIMQHVISAHHQRGRSEEPGCIFRFGRSQTCAAMRQIYGSLTVLPTRHRGHLLVGYLTFEMPSPVPSVESSLV